MARRSIEENILQKMDENVAGKPTDPPLRLYDSFSAAFRHGGSNFSVTAIDDPQKVLTVMDSLPEEIEKLNIISNDDVVQVNIYVLDKEKILAEKMAAEEKEIEEKFAKLWEAEHKEEKNMKETLMYEDCNDVDLDALD